MRSSIARHDADGPFSWHHFSELDEALEAVRAADLLEIPFVLHKREREMEGDVLEIDYVVVLMAPGTEFDLFPDEGDEGDEGDTGG